MRLVRTMTTVLLAAGFCLPAVAQEAEEVEEVDMLDEDDPMAEKDMEKKQIESWQALKDECARFAANDQIKPFKVEISCRVRDTIWTEVEQPEGEAATTPLQNERSIAASVVMKNLALPVHAVPADLEDVEAPCVMYDQYTRTAGPVTETVECSEIEEVEDLHQHCHDIVVNRVEDGGVDWELEPTGQSYDSCRTVDTMADEIGDEGTD